MRDFAVLKFANAKRQGGGDVAIGFLAEAEQAAGYELAF